MKDLKETQINISTLLATIGAAIHEDLMVKHGLTDQQAHDIVFGRLNEVLYMLLEMGYSVSKPLQNIDEKPLKSN